MLSTEILDHPLADPRRRPHGGPRVTLRPRVGPGPARLEPRRRPAARARRAARRRRRRAGRDGVRPRQRAQGRPAGHRPQRDRDRVAGGHDPRLDPADARRRDRRRGPDRPRRGRHAVGGGHRGLDAARPVPALGLLAGRRRRRLHARRRPQLALAQARPGGQPRHRDRARHPRRRAPARHGGRAPRAVLGVARRRRQLRRRDGDGVPPLPPRRGLRRHVPVALRAPRRAAARLARLDPHGARRDHDVVPASSTSRRCRSCRRSCPAARWW